MTIRTYGQALEQLKAKMAESEYNQASLGHFSDGAELMTEIVTQINGQEAEGTCGEFIGITKTSQGRPKLVYENAVYYAANGVFAPTPASSEDKALRALAAAQTEPQAMPDAVPELNAESAPQAQPKARKAKSKKPKQEKPEADYSNVAAAPLETVLELEDRALAHATYCQLVKQELGDDFSEAALITRTRFSTMLNQTGRYANTEPKSSLQGHIDYWVAKATEPEPKAELAVV